MILAFDIGNTNAAAGLFAGGTRPALVSYWKFRRPRKAGLSWWMELSRMACAEAGIDPRGIEGCAVSSVVPEVSRLLAPALRRITGRAPLLVRGGLPLGIRIAYAEPDLLGPDRVCSLLAGMKKYGAPLILVDCGTAITVDGLSRGNIHIGGMIAPGLAMSARSLGRSTAALPSALWGVPAGPAGTDTIGAIRSGVWHGAVGGIRECVRSLKSVVGRSALVIGTGGDAPVLMEAASLFDAVDPALVLEGAALAWRIAGGSGRGAKPGAGNRPEARRGRKADERRRRGPTSRRRGAKR